MLSVIYINIVNKKNALVTQVFMAVKLATNQFFYLLE